MEQRVGHYVLRAEGGRLEITRRPGLLGWLLARLGLWRPRPVLSVEAREALGAVEVVRRKGRAGDLKHPAAARRWQVRVLGPDREPLCRAFGFREAAEAERFAGRLRSFAAADRGGA